MNQASNMTSCRRALYCVLAVMLGPAAAPAALAGDAPDYMETYQRLVDGRSQSGPVNPNRQPDVAPLALSSLAATDLLDDSAMNSASERLVAVRESLDAEPEMAMKGETSVRVFKKAAPAVVLIVTETGIGSGALLNNEGEIITNWHVVGAEPVVQVYFMPEEGQSVDEDAAHLADVLRVNRTRDLALVKLRRVPEQVSTIELGDASGLEIGQDVHAIGHPLGETWTYTLGIVSQVRNDYQWGLNGRHRARIIQTQTPISPGNSGGPLLDDRAGLVGINSFKATEAEGMNYAVSVENVKAFLNGDIESHVVPSGIRQQSDEFIQLITERDWNEWIDSYETDANGDDVDDTVLIYDLNANGVEDAQVVVFGGETRALVAFLDRNEDRYPDLVIRDMDASGRPEEWIYDTDYDGQPDAVAVDLDEDGEIDQIKRSG